MPMLTDASEIHPGLTVFHVYGHLALDVKKYVIVEGPIRHPDDNTDTPSRWIKVERHGLWKQDPYLSLWDCGIGKNYNNNRLFHTEEEAIAYWRSPECRERRRGLDTDYE